MWDKMCAQGTGLAVLFSSGFSQLGILLFFHVAVYMLFSNEKLKF